MTETARLEIVADTKGVRNATSDLDRLAKQGAKTEGIIGGLTKGFAALGGALLVKDFLGAVIRNTMEAEQVLAQLNAVIKSTGGAAGVAAEDVLALSSALQGVTVFDDESITGAQNMLLTFRNIGSEVFPRATEAVLDLATVLKTDLKSASIQVGKALNDPAVGLTALSRAGITFSDSQKKVIKELFETGRVAEAQRTILKELETQMGGSARAARDTLGGALQSLQNAFGDLLEGDSGSDGVRGTKEAIEQLTAVMQSSETKAGFQTIITGLAQVTKFTLESIGMLAGFTEAINQTFKSADEKSFQGLIDQELMLTDSINNLSGKNGALGKFIGVMEGLQYGGNTSLFESEADNIARMSAELEKVRAMIDKRNPNNPERPDAGSAQDAIDAAIDAAMATDVLSEKTSELITKLNEEAAAFGLSNSALLEREKATALAAAGNDREREAIAASYDALISKVKADEDAAGSARGAAEANRLNEEAMRAAEEAANDLASAQSLLEGIIRNNAGALGGEAVQAAMAYADELEQVQAAENELIRLGKLDADAQERLNLARQQSNELYQKEIEFINAKKSAGEQLLDDLQFELELMKMTNEERAVALQLRGLDAADVEKYGAAIRSANADLEDAMRIAEGMDVVRGATQGLLEDIAEGAKSASDMLEDFFMTIINGITRLVAAQLTESLFGSPGSSGGGAGGDVLGSLLSGLFGRAIGGHTAPNTLYRATEQGPEMFSDGQNDYLLTGSRPGKVTPNGRGGGEGRKTIINVNVPKGTDRFTAEQTAMRTGEKVNSAMARNN